MKVLSTTTTMFLSCSWTKSEQALMSTTFIIGLVGVSIHTSYTEKGSGGGLKVWQFIAWVLLTWTRTVITQSADLQTGLHKWHTLLLNTSEMLTWSHLHSPTSCTQRALYSNNINLSLTLVLAFRAAFSSSGFVQSAKDTSRPTVLATFWK